MALAEIYFCQVFQSYVGHRSYSKHLLPEYVNAFLINFKFCILQGWEHLVVSSSPTLQTLERQEPELPAVSALELGLQEVRADPHCREKTTMGQSYLS